MPSPTRLPQGYPKASIGLPTGVQRASPRLPYGYPKATLRLPYGYPKATRGGGEYCRVSQKLLMGEYLFSLTAG